MLEYFDTYLELNVLKININMNINILFKKFPHGELTQVKETSTMRIRFARYRNYL
jgi:hypothetical protein